LAANHTLFQISILSFGLLSLHPPPPLCPVPDSRDSTELKTPTKTAPNRATNGALHARLAQCHPPPRARPPGLGTVMDSGTVAGRVPVPASLRLSLFNGVCAAACCCGVF